MPFFILNNFKAGTENEAILKAGILSAAETRAFAFIFADVGRNAGLEVAGKIEEITIR